MAKEEKWHTLKIEKLLKKFKSDLDGLDESVAEQKLEEQGYNEIQEKKRTTAFDVFLRQFKNFLIYVLLVAAFISAYIGKTIDFIVVSIIIIFVIILGFIQEYQAEKAMESLKKLSAPNAIVLRNGNEKEIPAKEIVTGDIILLEAGKRVPADARIIDSTNLKVDESALTGESNPVLKKKRVYSSDKPLAERHNMVFTGTHVVDGIGSAIVVSTGMDTEMGHLARLLENVEETDTPLRTKLNELSRNLALVVFAVGILILAMEIMKGAPVSEILLVIAALSVAGIPESMPVVTTVTLALGVKRMSRKKAIIRKLPTVETLGAASVICSDKTGTLTHSKMTLRKLFADSKMIDVTGRGSKISGGFFVDGKNIDIEEIDLLLKAGALCSEAYLEKEGNELIVVGDPTEGALLVAAAKGGFLEENLKKEYPKIGEVPFSRNRKCMTTAHITPDKEKVAFTKGAPEKILSICTHIYQNGEVKKLTQKEKEKILQVDQEMASEALRVLGLAYKELPDNVKKIDENLEADLVFLGLAGMSDPPRKEAIGAVRACKTAGIKPVMITGDQKITADAVARELGILEEGKRSLTSRELAELSDEEFEELVEDVAVYSRATPADKMRIVDAFQKKGHIVAMTGDGVNDAPALKNADIGVSMGVSGTDVAKEASDMVLADDNFATIVNAIKEGRTIFENLKQFIYYLIAGNMAEVILIATAIALGAPMPLTVLMILWVNLVTSEAPALGLAVEPPEKGIMHRKPRDPKENIPTLKLLLGLTQIGSVICIGVVLLFVITRGVLGASIFRARTMAFATLILFEMFHSFNARSLKQSIFKLGFFSNKYLLAGLFFAAVAMLAAIYLPFLQSVLGTTALALIDWVKIILVSMTVLVFGEISKYLKRKRSN